MATHSPTKFGRYTRSGCPAFPVSSIRSAILFTKLNLQGLITMKRTPARLKRLNALKKESVEFLADYAEKLEYWNDARIIAETANSQHHRRTLEKIRVAKNVFMQKMDKLIGS